jgi:hypothetical protein
MNEEEWSRSQSAPDMLRRLKDQYPDYFARLTPQLHRFFLASAWNIKHLIPQEHLQNGLRGAEQWLDGEISAGELSKLDWYSEAEAFAFSFVKTKEDLLYIWNVKEGIRELDGMYFDKAWKVLKNAAYFANSAMNYSHISTAPWVESLCTSEFLSADLLRRYIQPDFPQ